MKQWIYVVFTVDDSAPSDLDDAVHLMELSAEGWELVSVVSLSGDRLRYYIRRADGT